MYLSLSKAGAVYQEISPKNQNRYLCGVSYPCNLDCFNMNCFILEMLALKQICLLLNLMELDGTLIVLLIVQKIIHFQN